jgi:hypothetical protein
MYNSFFNITFGNNMNPCQPTPSNGVIQHVPSTVDPLCKELARMTLVDHEKIEQSIKACLASQQQASEPAQSSQPAQPSPCIGHIIAQSGCETSNSGSGEESAALQKKVSQQFTRIPKRLDQFPNTGLGNTMLRNVFSYLDWDSLFRCMSACKQFSSRKDKIILYAIRGRGDIYSRLLRTRTVGGNPINYPPLFKDPLLIGSITHLDISQMAIGLSDLRSIIQTHQSVVSVDLSNSVFSKAMSQILNTVAAWKLKRVLLGGCAQFDKQILQTLAKAIPTIEELDVSSTDISFDTFTQDLPRFPNLRVLYNAPPRLNQFERNNLVNSFPHITFHFETSPYNVRRTRENLKTPPERPPAKSSSEPGPKSSPKRK